ncbi:MAG: hypothetical protein ACPKPY_09825 [Nitrososphaeraceae archaeon]
MNIFSKEYYNQEKDLILIDAISAEDAPENQNTVKVLFKINCSDQILETMLETLIPQILDEFVYPEVMKKVEKRMITSDFRLYAAHILLFSNPIKNKILLNDDVSFKIHADFVEGNQFEYGQPVYFKDIKTIFGIYPTKCDPNAAHVMIIKLHGKWYIACDLIYDRQKVNLKFKNAQSFLAAAILCKENKLFGPYVDNLYSSTELAIQSILLLQRRPHFSSKQTHEETRDLFSLYAKNGNIDKKYSEHYSKLLELRKKGRYLIGVRKNGHIIDENKTEEVLLKTKDLISLVDTLLEHIDFNKKPDKGGYVGIGKG